MYKPLQLPGGFVLFISFLFTIPLVTLAEPTSPLDPFRHIAKHAQKEPEQPVCCLKPLTPNEPTEEILSFEDWKAKQEQLLHVEQVQVDGPKASSISNTAGGHPLSAEIHQESLPDSGVNVEALQQPPSASIPSEPIIIQQPAHSRVPLTDRFNYASLDCSARVYQAHKSARSPASVLSSKKDRYLLSPCQTPEEKFIVVELCDDIRIDTVQLANFEFFSGVFKDFSVSVARTYPENSQDWTPAGTYRAKNVRGIQSFHTPTSLRDFYRYIRIDFHSHFGNEYYCPISLLRVYGLTHLEQWKWEVWEAEFEARHAEQATRSISSGSNPVVEDSIKVIKETPDDIETHDNSVDISSKSELLHTESASSFTTSLEHTPSNATPTKTISSATSESASSHISVSTMETISSSATESIKTEVPAQSTNNGSDFSAPTSNSQEPSSIGSDPSVSEATQIVSELGDSSATSIPTEVITKSGEATPVQSSQIPTIIPHERAISGVTSGESIYRTIMTRLSLLEGNSTLYLRYVEEQTRSMRDALRRLEEDLGRIEGIGRVQSQQLQKSLHDWERQRRRLEREHGDLQTRLNYLTDEVILEKRLGIAQLFLLLTVLVFMALTRGSRGEPIVAPRMTSRRDSLKEWGRRHLSSFGSREWSSKLSKRSPTSPSEDFVKSPFYIKKEDKAGLPLVQFKVEGTQLQGIKENVVSPPVIRYRTPSEIRVPHPRQFVSHRPKTPTSSSFSVLSQTPRASSSVLLCSVPGPSNSSSGRPKLRRTSSHNSPINTTHPHSTSHIISTPLSAKKWAKTAHLHEMRRSGGIKHNSKPVHHTATTKANETPRKHRSASLTRTDQKSGTKPGSDASLFWPVEVTDSATRGRLGDRVVFKPVDVNNSTSPRSGPLSVSPLQNRARSREDDDLTKLTALGSPWHHHNRHTGGHNIIDLGTESESWIDTDIEGSTEESSPL